MMPSKIVELTTEDGCHYQYDLQEIVLLAGGLCTAQRARDVMIGCFLAVYSRRGDLAHVKRVVAAHTFDNSEFESWWRESINVHNLNRPTSQLVCPACKVSGQAFHDREEHEHPGTFTCRKCGEDYYA